MAFGIEGQADVVKIVTFPSGLYRAILLIDFQAVKKKIKILFCVKLQLNILKELSYIPLIGMVRRKSNIQVSQIQ